MRGWRALLLALTLIAAACSSSDTETTAEAVDAATTVPEPDETTTTATEAADEETVDAEVDSETEEADEPSEPAVPATFAADADLLDGQFMPLEPGTYRVDTVGTPFSFTAEEQLWIQPNDAAHFVLSHPSSRGPDDRDLVFYRVSDLADPAAPNATPEEQEGKWARDDIEGWLDSVIDEVEVSNRTEVALGDRTALRFDVELANGTECSPDGFCVGFATNRLLNGISFSHNFTYRIWWIDQGAESPLVVSAATNRPTGGWFDTAEAVMATVAFGDTAPNPIPADGDLWTIGFSSEVPVGTIDIPALGGVRFEVAEETFLIQERTVGWNALQIPGGGPADSEFFLLGTEHSSGATLETADDVVAALEAAGMTVSEVDPTTLAGADARVFDIASSRPGAVPILVSKEDSTGEGGWSAPLEGRAWLAETDRGLLVVTAEIFDPSGDLDAVIAQSELIVETFEFITLD